MFSLIYFDAVLVVFAVAVPCQRKANTHGHRYPPAVMQFKRSISNARDMLRKIRCTFIFRMYIVKHHRKFIAAESVSLIPIPPNSSNLGNLYKYRSPAACPRVSLIYLRRHPEITMPNCYERELSFISALIQLRNAARLARPRQSDRAAVHVVTGHF